LSGKIDGSFDDIATKAIDKFPIVEV